MYILAVGFVSKRAVQKQDIIKKLLLSNKFEAKENDYKKDY